MFTLRSQLSEPIDSFIQADSERSQSLHREASVVKNSRAERTTPSVRVELSHLSFNGFGGGCRLAVGWGGVSWAGTHVVLGEVDEILQVNVVSVRLDVVVDKKVELIFDPVFKDESEDPCRQLQEEDQTQEHGKLKAGEKKQKKHNEQ